MKKKSSKSRFGDLPQNCFYSDLRNGEIDKIIKKFNGFEMPFFEYSSNPKDIGWWDFVRYDIIHSICIEKGLYGNHKDFKKNFFLRLPSLIIQTRNLFFSIKNFFNIDFKNIRFLSISSRRLNLYFKHNDYKDEQTLIVVKNPAGNYYKNLIYKDSLENIIKFISKFIRVPHQIELDSKNISGIINSSISTNVDISRLIKTKYKYCIAAIYVWKIIFKFFLKKVNTIKYTNDDLQKPLVYVASLKNIKTFEIQHAYMGKSHEAFSYPFFLKKPLSIPNYTLVYFDSKDITYPSKIINYYNEEEKNSQTKKNIEIDLLIGSSPRKAIDTLKILSIIQGLNLRLAIKLHPAECLSNLNIKEFLKNESIRVIDGKENFSNIAAITKIFIPISHNSTTIFEARKQNCEIIIFDEFGRKFTNIPNLVKPIFCYSSNSLKKLINQILRS